MAFPADPDDEPAERGALLRLLTLVLGSAEVIAVLLLAHLMLASSDPLGADIGDQATVLIAAPILGFTLPGLLLAWLNRAPRVALALVLLGIPAAALCWSAA